MRRERWCGRRREAWNVTPYHSGMNLSPRKLSSDKKRRVSAGAGYPGYRGKAISAYLIAGSDRVFRVTNEQATVVNSGAGESTSKPQISSQLNKSLEDGIYPMLLVRSFVCTFCVMKRSFSDFLQTGQPI